MNTNLIPIPDEDLEAAKARFRTFTDRVEALRIECGIHAVALKMETAVTGQDKKVVLVGHTSYIGENLVQIKIHPDFLKAHGKEA